ncbi:hypothetical protein CH63R_07153 [Colletotrichum higginsianum IMI 349063]|uniref:Uncharacterized protein n=1 Tax=Colletotrichum higginsianum (strain IMI 349063) TaxID=759273 RepID=A0A1B7Y906_COLHI|nr:hypothetical protein CH63R_07153 [Colletotrichum higginsianum IMI 349063]OBR08388.1 hypothetical protein CH63R_07153 [Colletotrichum higginsianum IMI 349063]
MSNGSYNSNFGGRDAYGRDRNEPGSSSSAFSRSSGQSQQQTTQGNLPQYAPTTRRSQQPSSQGQSQTGYSDQAFGTQSSRASRYSETGSARHESEIDRKRFDEVVSTRRERREYAKRLPGPPRPPAQRPSAADDVRAYERVYGRQQQHVPAPTVYYDDQFGQLPSASGYAQVLPELEDYDTSNTRRSHSSHSKGHGSQQKHKRPHH